MYVYICYMNRYSMWCFLSFIPLIISNIFTVNIKYAILSADYKQLLLVLSPVNNIYHSIKMQAI